MHPVGCFRCFMVGPTFSIMQCMSKVVGDMGRGQEVVYACLFSLTSFLFLFFWAYDLISLATVTSSFVKFWDKDTLYCISDSMSGIFWALWHLWALKYVLTFPHSSLFQEPEDYHSVYWNYTHTWRYSHDCFLEQSKIYHLAWTRLVYFNIFKMFMLLNCPNGFEFRISSKLSRGCVYTGKAYLLHI